MTNNEKYSGVWQKDFKADSLLLMVAKENIALACRLSEEFGGTTPYVHKLGYIKKGSRDREILERARKLERCSSIAQSMGLSHHHTRKIIHAERRRLFSKYLRENPLTKGDEYE
jgi:hypothetical protein